MKKYLKCCIIIISFKKWGDVVLKVAFCSLSISEKDADSLISSVRFGESEKQRLRSIGKFSARLESLSALSALGSIAPQEELTILRTELGKPFFAASSLHFSLAHADGLGVAALSSSPVGIDIEWTDQKRNISAISKRLFTLSEQEQMELAEDRELAFFSVWTKKEAFAKLTGKGLISVCSCDDIEGKQFKQYILSHGERKAVISVCTDANEEILFSGIPNGMTLQAI